MKISTDAHICMYMYMHACMQICVYKDDLRSTMFGRKFEKQHNLTASMLLKIKLLNLVACQAKNKEANKLRISEHTLSYVNDNLFI